MQKLFVVVRADLPQGLQDAQLAHAAIQFVFEHPQLAESWYYGPNNIIVKQVPDEEALSALWDKLRLRKVAMSSFTEPDLGGQLTAISLGGEGVNALLRELPLTGQPQAAAA